MKLATILGGLGSRFVNSGRKHRRDKGLQAVRQAVVEALEQRQMLSSEPLVGTDAANNWYLRLQSGTQTVDIYANTNGTGLPSWTFDKQTLDSLTIDAGDGDDRVYIDLANGSPLNDGVLHFVGGDGWDQLVIIGTSGDDGFYLRRQADSSSPLVDIYQNIDGSGSPTYSLLRDELDSLTIKGQNGSDTLVADYADGDLLQDGALGYQGGSGSSYTDTLVIKGQDDLKASLNIGSSGTAQVDHRSFSYTSVEQTAVDNFRSLNVVDGAADDTLTIDSPMAGQTRMRQFYLGQAVRQLTVTNTPYFTFDASDHMATLGDSVSVGDLSGADSLEQLNLLFGSSDNTLTVSGPTKPMTLSVISSGTLAVTVGQGGVLNLPTGDTFDSLTIENGGRVNLTGGGAQVLDVGQLSLANFSGTLDLGKNDLLVRSIFYDDLRQMLYVGYAGGDVGPGIISSDLGSGCALGWAEGSYAAVANAGTLVHGVLDGVPFDTSGTSTAVIVKYIYLGDANWDGEVDGADGEICEQAQGIFDPVYNPAHWVAGDFNYDGQVDGDDLELWYDNQTEALGDPTFQVSSPSSGEEGAEYALTALSSNVAERWTIYWGDGTPVEFLDAPVEEMPIHVFADDGNYSITVVGHTADLSYLAGQIQVAVTNVEPSVVISGDLVYTSGQPYTFNLSSSDPGDDAVNMWDIDGHEFGDVSSATRVFAGDFASDVSVWAYDDDNGYVRYIPAIPTVGSATAVNGHQIDVTWTNNSTYATGFGIYQQKDGDTEWTYVGSAGANDTSFSAPGPFEANTSYSFRVRAVNDHTTNPTYPDRQTSPASAMVTAATPSGPTIEMGDDILTTEASPVALTATIADPGAGGPLTYEWQVYDNGQPVGAPGTNLNFNFTPLDDGTYTATLVVTDKDGWARLDSLTITSCDVPPLLTATGPASANEGYPYVLTASGTDDGQDTIVRWYINWGDGTATHIYEGAAITQSYTYSDAAPTHLIAATAEDDGGALFMANDIAMAIVPAAPSGAALNPSKTMLTWTDHSGIESGFKIEMAFSSADGFTQIGTTAANLTSHPVSGVPVGAIFRVRAVTPWAASAYSNDGGGISEDATPISFQTPNDPPQFTDSMAILNWPSPIGLPDVDRYDVKRNSVVVAQLPSTASQYVDIGLSPATYYTYLVDAVASNGIRENVKPAITIKTADASSSDYTAPLPPAGDPVISGSLGSLLLSWPASPSAVHHYAIYRDQSPWTITSGTSYSLGSDARYSYQVRAVDAAGNYSSAVSVTTAFGSLPAVTDEDYAPGQIIPQSYIDYFYDELVKGLRSAARFGMTSSPDQWGWTAQRWLDCGDSVLLVDPSNASNTLKSYSSFIKSAPIGMNDINGNGWYDSGDDAWIDVNANGKFNSGDTVLSGSPGIGWTGSGQIYYVDSNNNGTMQPDEQKLLSNPWFTEGNNGNVRFDDNYGTANATTGNGTWDTGEPIWIDKDNDGHYSTGDQLLYQATGGLPPTIGAPGLSKNLYYLDLNGGGLGSGDIVWVDKSFFRQDFHAFYIELESLFQSFGPNVHTDPPTVWSRGSVLAAAGVYARPGAGTVSVAKDSWSVTGTGFKTVLHLDRDTGTFIQISGDWYPISSISSDTQLTLGKPALQAVTAGTYTVINWTLVPEVAPFAYKGGTPSETNAVFPVQFAELHNVLSQLNQRPNEYGKALLDAQASSDLRAICADVIGAYESLFGQDGGTDSLMSLIQTGRTEPGALWTRDVDAEVRGLIFSIAGAVYKHPWPQDGSAPVTMWDSTRMPTSRFPGDDFAAMQAYIGGIIANGLWISVGDATPTGTREVESCNRLADALEEPPPSIAPSLDDLLGLFTPLSITATSELHGESPGRISYVSYTVDQHSYANGDRSAIWGRLDQSGYMMPQADTVSLKAKGKMPAAQNPLGGNAPGTWAGWADPSVNAIELPADATWGLEWDIPARSITHGTMISQFPSAMVSPLHSTSGQLRRQWAASIPTCQVAGPTCSLRSGGSSRHCHLAVFTGLYRSPTGQICRLTRRSRRDRGRRISRRHPMIPRRFLTPRPIRGSIPISTTLSRSRRISKASVTTPG